MSLPATDILTVAQHPAIFGPWFRDPATWAPWFAFLRALFGLPLIDGDRQLFETCTGRTEPPAGGACEAWLVCGRRAGKSFVLALIAVYLAVFKDWKPYLSPGERGHVMILATNRRQARVIFRYIRALLVEVPALKTLVEKELTESLELANGITIEVQTASFRSIRGHTIIAACLDETAFWRSEESANPDREVLDALRPAMATVPGALLLCASSPYTKRGILYDAYRRYWGQPGPVLVWRAATRVMNPTVPEKVVQDAYERDAASAAAEFGAEFRTDIAGFLDRGIVDAAIDSGVQVRPPIEGVRYIAFADPSGGARDAFTVGIAHAENGTAVLDAVFERRPPFNPATVVAEIRDFLRSYRISSVVGDRYGAAWVTTAFAQVGVRYTHSRRDRSAIYLDALPLFTSGRVRLIDNPRLAAQLASLERRTSPGGRDRVDHGPGGHDDLANAAAGAITLATAPSQTAPIVEPIIVRIDTVDRWSNDDAAMTYSHYMASIGR